MFTPSQYREEAVGYGKLVTTANNENERREFQELERRFIVLADNEQWLADNQDKIVRTAEPARSEVVALPQDEEVSCGTLGQP